MTSNYSIKRKGENLPLAALRNLGKKYETVGEIQGRVVTPLKENIQVSNLAKQVVPSSLPASKLRKENESIFVFKGGATSSVQKNSSNSHRKTNYRIKGISNNLPLAALKRTPQENRIFELCQSYLKTGSFKERELILFFVADEISPMKPGADRKALVTFLFRALLEAHYLNVANKNYLSCSVDLKEGSQLKISFPPIFQVSRQYFSAFTHLLDELKAIKSPEAELLSLIFTFIQSNDGDPLDQVFSTLVELEKLPQTEGSLLYTLSLLSFARNKLTMLLGGPYEAIPLDIVAYQKKCFDVWLAILREKNTSITTLNALSVAFEFVLHPSQATMQNCLSIEGFHPMIPSFIATGIQHALLEVRRDELFTAMQKVGGFKYLEDLARDGNYKAAETLSMFYATSPFLSGITVPEERMGILEALQEGSEEEAEEIAHLTKSFLHGLEGVQSRLEAIKTHRPLLKIPKGEKEAIVGWLSQAEASIALQEVSENDREEIARIAKPILDQFQDHSSRSSLLRSIQPLLPFSEEERITILQLTLFRSINL